MLRSFTTEPSRKQSGNLRHGRENGIYVTAGHADASLAGILRRKAESFLPIAVSQWAKKKNPL